MSIDTHTLMSLETDARRRDKIYFITNLSHKLPQITRMPLPDLKPYIYIYILLSQRLDYVLFLNYIINIFRLGEKKGTLSKSSLNSLVLVLLFIYIFI